MRLRRRRRKLTAYERGMWAVILVNVAFYTYIAYEFPPFIKDLIIYSIGSALLSVEGFLLALTPQLGKQEQRFAVFIGLITVLASVVTISKAYFESVQLNYLSYFPTTLLFDSDVVLFGIFVGVYAVSVLYPQAEQSDQERPSSFTLFE
jgi:hypothetical protein